MFGTQNDANHTDAMVNDQAFKDMAADPANPAASTDTGRSGIITPSAPALSAQPVPVSVTSNSMPPAQPSMPTAPTMPTNSTPAMPPNVTTGSGFDDELMNIKHDALTALSPLVSHIEQTPTEKFRTLMMMIQGADDKSLIKPAYEAARAIEDEKERAQALLDIVNEINYFTQAKDQLPLM